MKNRGKLFGIIIMVAVIGLALVGCDNGTTSGSDVGGVGGVFDGVWLSTELKVKDDGRTATGGGLNSLQFGGDGQYFFSGKNFMYYCDHRGRPEVNRTVNLSGTIQINENELSLLVDKKVVRKFMYAIEDNGQLVLTDHPVECGDRNLIWGGKYAKQPARTINDFQGTWIDNLKDRANIALSGNSFEYTNNEMNFKSKGTFQVKGFLLVLFEGNKEVRSWAFSFHEYNGKEILLLMSGPNDANWDNYWEGIFIKQ